MDLTQIITFSIVALLLVISPGPNGVLIAKTVPTAGRRPALACICGFIAAFYLHGALSVFGLSLILLKSAELFFVVKMLGAAYLCWIGLRAIRTALSQGPVQTVGGTHSRKKNGNLRGAFLEGFLTNALNPKVSMFYLAAFPQFVPTSGDVLEWAFVLVSVHCLLNAAWFGLMILFLTRLGKAAANPGFQRWLKGVTGIVFIGFGAKLATTTP